MAQLHDPAVELALRMFCYRVRKCVGAYLAVLGGADAIIFGGGIGENTAMVREQICQDLDWCGVILDKGRNAQANDREMMISAPNSSIGIWVIPNPGRAHDGP